MDTNYRKEAKKVLMEILQYSLEHRTHVTTLYKRVNESLQKQIKNSNGGYTHRQIDDLTKKLLLSDSKLINILRKHCNIMIKCEISNLSYGAVYRFLARSYFKSVEFETPKNYNYTKTYVPKEPKKYNGKVKVSRDLTKRNNGTKRSTY